MLVRCGFNLAVVVASTIFLLSLSITAVKPFVFCALVYMGVSAGTHPNVGEVKCGIRAPHVIVLVAESTLAPCDRDAWNTN